LSNKPIFNHLAQCLLIFFDLACDSRCA